MLKPFIKAAVERVTLSAADAETAMGVVMRGEASPPQIAAWLIALRQKGETPAEIAGFARAMRAAMVSIPIVPEGAIDTCGTGGDGLGTFNISTAAALITAAAGVPVAKHGNRAVSSSCGSADVLHALGFEIDPGLEVVTSALNETGFAFLFAPRFHPAMRHAAGPRREIGVRTVFNILGPLCNPAGVKRQIVGIYDRGGITRIAEVLGVLGAERVLIVSGPDGADELLPTGENRIAEWRDGTLTEYTLGPEDFGLDRIELADLKGTDADGNAEVIREIARGKLGPKTETAILNAGAAIWVSGRAESLREGIAVARAAVVDGRLLSLLDKAGSASRVQT
jgi:anthranilate phosphoribosyltransferase